jgi:hypothetical protein
MRREKKGRAKLLYGRQEERRLNQWSCFRNGVVVHYKFLGTRPAGKGRGERWRGQVFVYLSRRQDQFDIKIYNQLSSLELELHHEMTVNRV